MTSRGQSQGVKSVTSTASLSILLFGSIWQILHREQRGEQRGRR